MHVQVARAGNRTGYRQSLTFTPSAHTYEALHTVPPHTDTQEGERAAVLLFPPPHCWLTFKVIFAILIYKHKHGSVSICPVSQDALKYT